MDLLSVWQLLLIGIPHHELSHAMLRNLMSQLKFRFDRDGTNIEFGWRFVVSTKRKYSIWVSQGRRNNSLPETRSSYVTNRPLLTTTIQDHVVSRDWMSLTKWTYVLGDSKAIGGHELALIASKVFNSMIKTRVESTVLSHSVADFNRFRNDMSNFNDQIASWGDYWRSAFSTRKSGHYSVPYWSADLCTN